MQRSVSAADVKQIDSGYWDRLHEFLIYKAPNSRLVEALTKRESQLLELVECRGQYQPSDC